MKYQRGHLLLIALFSSSFWIAESRADPFSAELERLSHTSPQTAGIQELRASYEKLVQDHPDHPDRAEAMFRLANLWNITDPTIGATPDQEKVKAWVLAARQAAKPGSKFWLQASFSLAGIYRWTAIEKTKPLLQEILDHSPNTIVDAQAYYQLQVLAVSQKDYQEAERICHMLQDWMADKEKQPESMLEKGRFFEWTQASASSMMIAWSEMMRSPTETRRAKIEAFYQRYRGRQYIKRAYDRAIQHLEQLIYVPTPLI